MTDPREPIREAISDLAFCSDINARQDLSFKILAALDNLRIVQPGEIVLTARQFQRLNKAVQTAYLEIGDAIDALLTSWPGGEAD